MSARTRRNALKALGASALASAAGVDRLPAYSAPVDLKYRPEQGASLRLLRWKRYVQGDEDQWGIDRVFRPKP
jgi:multiple sugar transport system substrate-binding protein